jgi:putative oxidoreductase
MVLVRSARCGIQTLGESAMNRDRLVETTLFLLRVVAGLLFMQAGGTKILDWFGGIPAQFGGHPKFMSEIWFGGMLELIGGALIMVGLFTRPAAFVLSGEMAVAYFQFHFPQGFWPAQNHGEPAVLFCFIFLFFAAQGAGPWGLDALWKQRAHRGKSAES